MSAPHRSFHSNAFGKSFRHQRKYEGKVWLVVRSVEGRASQFATGRLPGWLESGVSHHAINGT